MRLKLMVKATRKMMYDAFEAHCPTQSFRPSFKVSFFKFAAKLPNYQADATRCHDDRTGCA